MKIIHNNLSIIRKQQFLISEMYFLTLNHNDYELYENLSNHLFPSMAYVLFWMIMFWNNTRHHIFFVQYIYLLVLKGALWILLRNYHLFIQKCVNESFESQITTQKSKFFISNYSQGTYLIIKKYNYIERQNHFLSLSFRSVSFENCGMIPRFFHDNMHFHCASFPSSDLWHSFEYGNPNATGLVFGPTPLLEGEHENGPPPPPAPTIPPPPNAAASEAAPAARAADSSTWLGVFFGILGLYTKTSGTAEDEPPFPLVALPPIGEV